MRETVLQLDPRDNVLIALRDLRKSEEIRFATKYYDIDAGPIISAEKTVEQMGEATLDALIEVASGEARPKAEWIGHDDFIPWKRGVSL